jgi:hypothetical protein
MATRAKLGTGSRVRIGRGSTPTWTTIRECRDIVTPSRSRADVDVTNQDSPNFTEENILGLIGAVDWPLEHTYEQGSAEDTLFRDLQETGELVLLEIRPAGSTVDRYWQARVKDYTVSLPVKAEQRATVTLRVQAEVAAPSGGGGGGGG